MSSFIIYSIWMTITYISILLAVQGCLLWWMTISKFPYPSGGISSNPLTTWQLKWISMCTFSYMCEWSYKLSHNVIWVPPPNKRSHFSFLLSIESCVKFSNKLYLYDTWIYLTLIKSVLLAEFCTYMILMYDEFVPYNEQ